MKRIVILAAVVCALAGCQGTDTSAGEANSSDLAPKPKDVPRPINDKPTKIGLVLPKRPVITVGIEHPEKLLESFHDAKQFGSEYNDLPTNFKNSYKARTWETSHYGFGEITYEGNLVAAMYQEDGVSQDRVEDFVNVHKRQVDLLPDRFAGKRVSYWFWELDNQRLMICAYQTDRKGTKLTIAMGDDVVMDALGMSPKNAVADEARVDASLKIAPEVSTQADPK